MKVKITIRSEYACGHRPRVIAERKVRMHQLKADLAAMLVDQSSGGVLNFNCKCGRGAAFVEVLVNDHIVQRTLASAFRGQAGAIVTEKPVG
jgi:hypothetical protein